MPEDAETLGDAALARRIAAAGTALDSATETELYRRLAPRVRFYGLRHLRDRHAAHDLMQQVLLMMLERLRAGKVRVIRHRALARRRTCMDGGAS